jgi:predicted ABC-type exoprotein transport system permease subunit
MTENDKKNNNYLKEYSKYSSLIFQMILIAATGVLGGIQLDKWLKMKGPVFTITMTIVMTVVAIIHLFRTLLKK